MGTVGGSGAGKVGQTDLGKSLDSMFKGLLGPAGKAFKTELSQLSELLTSGGVGARIPMIQRAVEAAMAGGSQVAEKGREATSRAGLGGSPFDVASQLETQKQTSAAVASVPTNEANAMLGELINVPSNVVSGAQTSNQQDLSRQMFNASQIGRFYEDLKQSLEAAYPGASGNSGPTSASYPTTSSASMPTQTQPVTDVGGHNIGETSPGSNILSY